MRRTFVLLFTFLLTFLFCSSAVSEEKVSVPDEIPEDAVSVCVTFLGDCTLGCEERERENPTSFDSYIHEHGYDYPFSGVIDILREDDLTVANLESVFYNYEANKVPKTYNFRSSVDFVGILPVSSVEAVSLSNNHTEDYDAPGIRSTVAALEGAGVEWFATTEYANQGYIYEKDGIKIGFVSIYTSYWGYNIDGRYLHSEQLKRNIEALKEAGCSVLVGVMHGGVEYSAFHDEGQEKLANFFIRNGISVVVGHHPHVIQGVSVRDNATVVYSLGNFVFGGNKNMRALYTMLAQVTFWFSPDGTYLGHRLNIIPAQYSGSPDYNDYRPIPVDGEAADKVIEMIQRDSNFRLSPYVSDVGAVQPFVPAANP